MLLLRISLAVAILAGLATAVITFTQTQEKVTTVMAERDKNGRERDAALTAQKKAERERKDALAERDKTAEQLTSTKNELDTTQRELNNQKSQVADLTDRLAKETSARTRAQQDLAAWSALGYSVDQIKFLIATNKLLAVEREDLIKKGDELQRDLTRTFNELMRYKDPDYVVPLPATCTGKVTVVDPKWDFVILDVGEKHGALRDGELLVSRAGRLVAKVRIRQVEADHSIANVVPGWKLSEVMENDLVLP